MKPILKVKKKRLPWRWKSRTFVPWTRRWYFKRIFTVNTFQIVDVSRGKIITEKKKIVEKSILIKIYKWKLNDF